MRHSSETPRITGYEVIIVGGGSAGAVLAEMLSTAEMSVRSALVARLKKTLLAWIAAYPTVLLVLTFVGGFLRDWPLALQVLGASAIIVPIVANVTGPGVRAASDAIARELARRWPRKQ